MPQLRNALTSRVLVEQAKGFLRETLDVSVEQAFQLLRGYARTNGEHLTEVARRLMTDRHSRPVLFAAHSRIRLGPTALRALPRTCSARRLLHHPFGNDMQLHVLGLADPGEPIERLLRADTRPAANDADRLIDHRPAVQSMLQRARPLLGPASSCALYTDTAAGAGELCTQLHGVLAERVAVVRA